MPLGAEVGLSPGDIVLDGDSVCLKRAQHPHFSAHVYFGQMAGWIKMPIVMEVGLDPGHIVLDGDPAPRQKNGTAPPIFDPWPNIVHNESHYFHSLITNFPNSVL